MSGAAAGDGGGSSSRRRAASSSVVSCSCRTKRAVADCCEAAAALPRKRVRPERASKNHACAPGFFEQRHESLSRPLRLLQPRQEALDLLLVASLLLPRPILAQARNES